MIQRIQTIYLMLATLVAILAFFFPIAWFYGTLHTIEFFVYEVVDHVKDNLPVLKTVALLPSIIIAALLILLPLYLIFQYKKLAQQLYWINLVIFLALVQIALQFFFYIPAITKAVSAEPTYSFGVFSPLLIIVFLLLARNGIRKDIRLLKSVDRIR